MLGRNNNPTTVSNENEDDNQYSEHSEHLFCYDPHCPCKESRVLIGDLADAVEEGLVSTDDANRIYRGRVV
jgi:hypothetical protein